MTAAKLGIGTQSCIWIHSHGTQAMCPHMLSLDSLDNALWGCHQAEQPTADTFCLETWIQPWKVPVIWRLALSGCPAVAEHWAAATTCGFYHATVRDISIGAPHGSRDEDQACRSPLGDTLFQGHMLQRPLWLLLVTPGKLHLCDAYVCVCV